MATTFTLLLIGFIGLDLAHFGFPVLTKPTAIFFILCALMAGYMMAAAIYAQEFGKEILPLGKPWIDSAPEPVGNLAKDTAQVHAYPLETEFIRCVTSTEINFRFHP